MQHVVGLNHGQLHVRMIWLLEVIMKLILSIP